MVFVTVPEGPGVQAQTAFLAGGARVAGCTCAELPTDYSTEEDGFLAALRDLRPSAVVFPYLAEFREIVHHLSAVAKRGLNVPVLVTGEGLQSDDLEPELEQGVLTWPGDPGDRLLAVLQGKAAGELDHGRIPADLSVFREGRAGQDPMLASLFVEPRTVCLWAGRPERNELPPTAMLARLEAPTGALPITLHESAALEPLARCRAPLERVEWWDRHASPAVLRLAASLARPDLHQSVRWLPERGGPEGLAELPASGVDRVVFEVDRVSGVEDLPGSAASAEELLPFVEAAREARLEVGLLLVLGLPMETVEAGDGRLEAVRALAPEHLRCVPFEPTGGHAVMHDLRSRGLPASGERRWNRELHRGLEADGQAGETFIHNWAAGHLLLAEVETRGGTAS